MIEKGRLLRTLKTFNEKSGKFIKFLSYGVMASLALSYLGVYDEVGKYISLLINILEVGGLAFIALHFAIRAFFTRNPLQDVLPKMQDQRHVLQVRNWLRGHSLPRPAENIDNLYCFANTEELIRRASDMNYESFLDSQFGFEKESMYWRNHRLISANDKVFMLMRDPDKPDVFFGFSYVIPLNKLATRMYLDGKISDSEIDPDCLPAKDERPDSLLIFAIALGKEYRLSRKSDNEKYLMLLVQGVMMHILLLCGGDREKIPVLYAQTEARGITRLLMSYGFKTFGKVSADGCEILRLYPKTAEYLFA